MKVLTPISHKEYAAVLRPLLPDFVSSLCLIVCSGCYLTVWSS